MPGQKPQLLILNDFFSGLKKSTKLDLINITISSKSPWTSIAVSNDPLVMAACDRVIVLNDGDIVAQGTFDELLKQNIITSYID